jgi:hypothetical protein
MSGSGCRVNPWEIPGDVRRRVFQRTGPVAVTDGGRKFLTEGKDGCR